jgi:hypothetical protein
MKNGFASWYPAPSVPPLVSPALAWQLVQNAPTLWHSVHEASRP